MKCTDCGQPLKPVVAVDIDGTLGDYYTQFHWFAEMYLDRDLPAGYAGDVEYSDYLGLDKTVYRDIKLAYRQGALKRSMPVYPGAVRFMATLQSMDYEVWIATTRPYLRLDNIDPDTRFWLNRHAMYYQYLLYGEDKYKQLVQRVEPERIAMVIDDLKEQCIEAADVIGADKVRQPVREHNRNLPWPYAFPNWAPVAQDLYKFKEQWDGANA